MSLGTRVYRGIKKEFTTILLLESTDIALMNRTLLIEAIQAAVPVRPPGVDQVWFVHTHGDEVLSVRELTSEIWS